jgi:hypothetical protein
MKCALFALFIMTIATPGLAAPVPNPNAPEPGHIVEGNGTADGPVTRQSFEARFDESAARLAAARPGVIADRFAAYDIAWPRDAAEMGRLNDHAVLLIGAVSQDASELPLAKVYLVRPDGSQVVLRHIASAERQKLSSVRAATVFGPNLMEDFYLVPMAALGEGVELRCDFAKNRLGFAVERSLSSPGALPAPSASVSPPAAAVNALVSREYRGFGVSFDEAAP